MIPDEQLPELRLFRNFEATIPFGEDADFANLVFASTNDTAPVHRWYRFKEGFSWELLSKLLKDDLSSIGRRFTMLDPFCGSGTSLVSAQLLASTGYEISAIGIERNPFIHFVAKTKTRWHAIDSSLLEKVHREAIRLETSDGKVPTLSSIRGGRCISRYLAKRIVGLRDALHCSSEGATRDAALLALASIVEPVSKVRKDGRALRITEKRPVNLNYLWRGQIDTIAADSRTLQMQIKHPSCVEVHNGDGREPEKVGIQNESVDLILTSPPYPNNIDYTEVYKLELWLMGFVSKSDHFYNMRLKTMRSHPIHRLNSGEKLVDCKEGALPELLGALLRRIKAKEKWRARMIQAYFTDMSLALESHLRCLRPGGYEVIVVGNSLHGNTDGAYLIPADLVISELARLKGFEVKRVISARHFRRRVVGNHFLRESVLVLQKPISKSISVQEKI